jgi:uncharacterized lipoprotein YddW (UPF0748 family)
VIKKQFKLRLLMIIALFTGISFNYLIVAAKAPRPEIRAIWVDAFHDGAKNPAQIDKLINDCICANLNTIIVQVRCRGEAYYNKSIEPRAEDRKLPAGFDVLQYLIDKAHTRHLEVHAWLNTLIAWNSQKKPPHDPNHLWNRHGLNATGRENWLSYYRKYNAATKSWSDELYPSYYLDPGNPEALDYTTKVYLNIVNNYNVDGIHLDYSRYEGLGWGYNSTNVERYNRCHGTTGLPRPDDPRWMQWRREQTANLVRKIYLQTIAIKPQIKVSSAVISWGDGPVSNADWKKTSAYTEAGQDWRRWLQEGIIDLVIPMNYFSEWKPIRQKWYNKWIEWEKNHQYGRQIVIGTGVFLQYIEHSLAQIRRTQQPSKSRKRIAGVALFAYAWNNLYSNENYIKPSDCKALPRQPHVYKAATNDWLFPLLAKRGNYHDPVWRKKIRTKPVFPNPAPIPAMPWKLKPVKGYLMGTVVAPSEKNVDHLPVVIAAVNHKKTKLKYDIFTDGSGWFGCAELPPGNYHIWVAQPQQLQPEPSLVTIRSGEVSEANLILK